MNSYIQIFEYFDVSLEFTFVGGGARPSWAACFRFLALNFPLYGPSLNGIGKLFGNIAEPRS